MPTAPPSVHVEPAGFRADGRSVEVYTLASRGGARLRAMTYGGTVLSLHVSDAEGRLADVVLGYDAPADYLDDPSCFGALVGRFANRIRAGRFRLDGRTVQLDRNDGAHHLHGGHRGLGRVVWSARPFEAAASRGVVLSYVSPDGEGGYPGTLRVRVTYALTDRNEWAVETHATTDRPTVVNLTQHPYFNLAGAGNVLGHRLEVAAGQYLPLDADRFPTGEVAPVAGTPLDFTRPRRLGERIADGHPQTDLVGGYNHTLVLDAVADPAATLTDPVSGRALTVRTTEPGLQLYTANHFDGIAGKGGAAYRAHDAVCLEPQHFPDAPNQPSFPSTVLRPGGVYRSRSVYAFSAG